MTSSSLEVPRRRQPEKRSRLWRILVIAATLAVAVGWLVWFLRTPADLPTSDESAEGSGVVDQVLYVGMFAVGDDFDRTIRISEVAVDVTPDDDVEVTPLVCRDGSVSVTTDVDAFCPELDEADGVDFSGGDSIVLAVTASVPTEVEVGRVAVSFRDGIRWGTKEAGLERATLSFVDHAPGTVEEDTELEDSTSDRPEQDDQGRDEDRKKKDRQGDDA